MRLATSIRGAAFLACLLAIPTLGLSIALPLYDDEFGWKMVDGRYLRDGLVTFGNSLGLTCGQLNFPVPWPLVPYRILDSWLYDSIDNPLWVRLSGILLAVLIVALIAIALQRVLSPVVGRRAVAIGVVGFATLGIFPFMLAMSRPEQLMLSVVGTRLCWPPHHAVQPAPRSIGRPGSVSPFWRVSSWHRIPRASSLCPSSFSPARC